MDKNNLNKYPRCPFTRNICDINIFRAYSTNRNIHCDTCKDYDKNYHTIVTQSIRYAEKNPNSNIHKIREAIKEDAGKYISFGINGEGILIGASTTNEDYYWIYLNKDRKVKCSSCVGAYEILKYIPTNMSIVEYLRKHQRKELLENVKEQIKKMKHDVLITNIYL